MSRRLERAKADMGLRAPGLLLATLNHRADARGHVVHRERFGQHRHPRWKRPVTEDCILRIAGDEQHFEVRV